MVKITLVSLRDFFEKIASVINNTIYQLDVSIENVINSILDMPMVNLLEIVGVILVLIFVVFMFGFFLSVFSKVSNIINDYFQGKVRVKTIKYISFFVFVSSVVSFVFLLGSDAPEILIKSIGCLIIISFLMSIIFDSGPEKNL